MNKLSETFLKEIFKVVITLLIYLLMSLIKLKMMK